MDVDKNFLYAKDPYEAKYQLLINKRERTSLKYLNDSKALIEYPSDMDDIFENIDEYKPNKKRKLIEYWLYLTVWLLIFLVIKNLI